MNTSEIVTTEEVMRLNDAIILPPVEELHLTPTPHADQIFNEAGCLFPLGDLYFSDLTLGLMQGAEAVGIASMVSARLARALAGHLTGRIDAPDAAISAYTEVVTGDPGHQVVTAWGWPPEIVLIFSIALGIAPEEFPEAFVIATVADRSRTVVLQSCEVVGTPEGEALAEVLEARAEGGPQE